MPSTINAALKDRGEPRRSMTLHLRLEKTEVQHYCMFCRDGLFRSRWRVFSMTFGAGFAEDFVFPPISFQCKKCGTVYHLQGLNE